MADRSSDPGFTDVEAQTLQDAEQTLSDSDQTLADADQTSADSDQASADRDQLAADSDQSASDRDLSPADDAGAHEYSRDIRKRTAHRREQTAQARLDGAGERDASARARDLAAQARDRAADARDELMRQRDAADEEYVGARERTGADLVFRAASQRARAAQDRLRAGEHREQAAEDRRAAARDRAQAARERLAAQADRDALACALAVTEADPLTGARTRAAGLADLGHEIDRCRRTGDALVIVYIDVIGLKTLNDTEGHSAGDALLKRTVTVIAEHLRSYDLVIRLGGDEFLCAMFGVRLPAARERFDAIAAALAGCERKGAFRTGFAELREDETLVELIARADAELLTTRDDEHARAAGQYPL